MSEKKQTGKKTAASKKVEKHISQPPKELLEIKEGEPISSEAALVKGKEEQKKDKKKKPLALRILFKTLRIVFLWIPLGLITVIGVVLIAAKLYLSPARVEKLAVENFSKKSYGTISLKVKSFSPYSGFDIENIIIRNGPEFDNSVFVQIDKLRLRYGFFSIFTGNIHFDEIGIYKPKVYVKEKKGVWNFARLMKPSESKPEPEKKEPEKEKSAKEGPIKIPIDVQFLLHFMLDDLRIYANSSTFDASVEGLTFKTDVEIPPFNQVDPSLLAVKILKTLNLELNPQEEIDVRFNSKLGEVKPPLTLTWKLMLDRNNPADPKFNSYLKFGTYKMPVRFKESHLAPLNFMISYNLYYNPLQDKLSLDSLAIRFKDKYWINMTGEVSDVTRNQNLDLYMKESNIVLDDLYPYYVAVLKDYKTKFSGSVSLYPLTVKGTLNKLDVLGELNVNSLNYRNNGMSAAVPSLKLSYNVEKTTKDILAKGALTIRDIRFKNPTTSAAVPLLVLDYDVKMLGKNAKILAGLNIPGFNYSLNKSQSRDHTLNLKVDVDGSNNFGTVVINGVDLKLYSPEQRKDALLVNITGLVGLKPDLAGTVNINRVTLYKPVLEKMLPEETAKGLVGLKLEQPVDLNMSANFAMTRKKTEARVTAGVKAPDFEMNDLKLLADITAKNNNKYIEINKVDLNSKEWGLLLLIDGFADISKSPLADSNIKLKFLFDAPGMKKMYAPWDLSGKIKMNAQMKGDLETGLLKGNIEINKLFVNNAVSKMSVEDVNLDFPFEYYLTPKDTGKSRLAVDKSSVIANEQFREKDNFTIKSVKIKHPSRDEQLLVMKNLRSALFFRDNAFEIVKLQCEALDGAVYGRDIMVNLNDLNKNNIKLDGIEYRLSLDITNVDIGKLDNLDPSKKTRDAELSLNANFHGKGLDTTKEMLMTGYINIYKIGDKFSNKLMTGLSSEKGKSKLGIAQLPVDNSLVPKGFYFNLDQGNMYTTVTFNKKILGLVVTVKDDKVEFDRVPIMEYLRKVSQGE